MSTPTVAKKSESKPPAKTKAKPKFIKGFKAVNKDLTSMHDPNFKYTVGKEAVVTNPDPKGVCGRGIHFSKTMEYPLEYAGFSEEDAADFTADYKMLELRVDPADILDESAEKSRAKRVFVVGVAKLDFPSYEPVQKRLAKLDGKLGTMACQTPEKRLRDLFTNFTRRNNLKGYSLKLVTSAYEAQWLADKLENSFQPAAPGCSSDVCCSPQSMQDTISEMTANLEDDVFSCYNNGCYQIQETVQWILHSLVSAVKPGAKVLKVDALMEMLEAGALPLGYSTANKSKTVYWFVPSTTSNKWFPTV